MIERFVEWFLVSVAVVVTAVLAMAAVLVFVVPVIAADLEARPERKVVGGVGYAVMPAVGAKVKAKPENFVRCKVVGDSRRVKCREVR